MAILTVGSGQQFSTIHDAVDASHDGDVIQIQAGVYYDDLSNVNTKITIEGVGGFAKLDMTHWLDNDRGYFVVNNDVTFDHIEFANAAGASGNDAGIRYQAGDMTITNSYFHGNQNGILAPPTVAGTGVITIRNSEFELNGANNGAFGTHQIYIGNVAKLVVDNSYFHDLNNDGNQIKSRALETDISHTRVIDGLKTDDWTSYEVDVANGGVFRLTDSTIVQGVHSQNGNIVEFGAEGLTHAANSIFLDGNTIVNDMDDRGVALYDPTDTAGQLLNTKVWAYNYLQMISGSNVTEAGTTELASRPTLDTSHPWDAASTPPPVDPSPPADPPPPVDSPPPPADPPPPVDPPPASSDPGEDWHGTSGDDYHQGWKYDDTLSGGAGNDDLCGQGGNDSVSGGSGDDTVCGDVGTDTVSGGAGADVFWMQPGGGHDLITDFQVGVDRFNLSDFHLQSSQLASEVHITDSAVGAVISVGDAQVVVLGAQASSFTASDFIL